MKKTKRLIRVTTTKKVAKKPEVKIAIGYVGLHKRRKTNKIMNNTISRFIIAQSIFKMLPFIVSTLFAATTIMECLSMLIIKDRSYN